MGKSRIIGGKSAGRRGSAIIETGLLLPLMVFMVCGTMDFARVFYAGIAITSAARAGVQFGSLYPSNAGRLTAMNDAATADAANQGLTGVTASSSTACGCAGATPTAAHCSDALYKCTVDGAQVSPPGYVQTTVSYTFTPIVPYPGVPASVVLNRTAMMRVQ